MWFSSKKEILEYCGKDWKDVRRLDRAIKDWRVIKMEWDYCTTADYIKELEDSESDSIQTIIKLKKEIEELKKSEPKQETVISSGLEEELKEAKIQWEYYSRLYEEEKADKQNRIRKCFRWIKQIKANADWDEFRDWVMNDEE